MSTQQHLDSGPVLAGGAGDDLEFDREEWAAVCPREITAEQWQWFKGYMLEIFTAVGMPAGTVSTAGTGGGTRGQLTTPAPCPIPLQGSCRLPA
jgi:hypothetical protein